MNTWCSFHTHTVHSTLDGMSQISGLVDRAVELGMPALGIADHGSLSGAYQVWKECRRAGIKPVVGIEVYLAPVSRHHKKATFWGELEGKRVPTEGNTHMTLIAKNATGLRNLYKLHHLSYTEGFYYHGRIDLELLGQSSDGLVATTGCAGGAIPTLLRLGQWDRALEYARRLVDIFGGDLYIEVMHHSLEFDDALNAQLVELAEIVDIPLLLTNDSHYTLEADAAVHDAVLCIGKNKKLADENRFKFSGSGYWLRSYDEMAALPLPPEALANTLVLADMIEPYDEVFEKRDLMPRHISVPGITIHDQPHSLREQVAREVERQSLGPEYMGRGLYEIDVIERMGYEDYFLVLADLMHFARDQGILVGPGRGSAGGSLVAYLLEITELDPIVHGLLFERFLNPSRISPPDIDVDFQDDRRDEVIQYAVDKYGHDRVAQLITFGTIKAKSAIKDANRVLGGEYPEGERLVGLLPKAVRSREPKLSDNPRIGEANPEVYELALGLEGLVRSEGKHAAGIIISPEPLPDIIPVKADKITGMLTSVFDQETLEAHGFVKLDLLGLKELSVIQKCLEMIGDE